MKKTLILGASDNTSRYAYKAARMLKSYGHPVVNVGIREGEVLGEPIHTDKPVMNDIDTVTLYVGTNNLPFWFDYILSVKPKRIIFNPGTEHPELWKLAKANGIEPIEGCTLVMLSIGVY